MRSVLVILDSRASYGYTRNLMRLVQANAGLELKTLVTGGHLMDEFGRSVKDIRADGFPVSAEVKLAPSGDSPAAWPRALGAAITGYADAYEALKPDIVLLAGDRIETFGCCVAATYMHLPIAHIQAGDKSGHIDDLARMAIAKLAHIHFAADASSAARLEKLGEQPFRIHQVGAPQLDEIVAHDYSAKEITINGVKHDLSKPYILLIQHPLLGQSNREGERMRDTIEVCLQTGLPTFCFYPNSDIGFRPIIEVIESFSASENMHFIRFLERRDYLTLLANAAVLVGNSSSGILEAPSFRVPVVNIGERQRGRLQSSNIINSSYQKEELVMSINKALHDEAFLSLCANATNVYGDGKSGQRICEILASVPIDAHLLDKQTVY